MPVSDCNGHCLLFSNYALTSLLHVLDYTQQHIMV